jgi:hypothetical protein
MRVQNQIKQYFNRRVKIAKFIKGYKQFQIDGKYNEESYYSMIDLFCITNGYFLDRIHNKLFSTKNKIKRLGVKSKLFSNIEDKEQDIINSTLKKNGYYVFDYKLPSEIVNRIKEYAFKTPCKIPPHYNKEVFFDYTNPLAEIYRFSPDDLMKNEDIIELIKDPVLINIARNYLGAEPIIDSVAMYGSTSFLKEPSSHAAQLYHFDLDRIKWLKIFIYLNDVDENSGPHYYIEGTHISGSKPQEILNRGYKRISDKELELYYSAERFKNVTGKAGSIFAGDTKCWHKGSVVKSGYRLVLELEYTSSLFGSILPKINISNENTNFIDYIKNNQHYMSNFVVQN